MLLVLAFDGPSPNQVVVRLQLSAGLGTVGFLWPVNFRISYFSLWLQVLIFYCLSYNSLLKVPIPFYCCLAVSGNFPTVSQVSPLSATSFAFELKQHPNQAFVSEVLQGLFQGCSFQPWDFFTIYQKEQNFCLPTPEIIVAYLAN